MIDLSKEDNTELMSMRRQLAITDIRFRVVYDVDPRDPTKQRAREWVSWRKADDGKGATTNTPVARLAPNRKQPHGALEWGAVGPAYGAWKQGKEAPIEGTPLDAWIGLDADDAEHLRVTFSIRSLEQFVAMGESNILRCAIPNVRERIERAKRFLASREDTAHIERAMAERDVKIAELEARLSAMADGDDEPAERRGPGRPRKTA